MKKVLFGIALAAVLCALPSCKKHTCDCITAVGPIRPLLSSIIDSLVKSELQTLPGSEVDIDKYISSVNAQWGYPITTETSVETADACLQCNESATLGQYAKEALLSLQYYRKNDKKAQYHEATFTISYTEISQRVCQ